MSYYKYCILIILFMIIASCNNSFKINDKMGVTFVILASYDNDVVFFNVYGEKDSVSLRKYDRGGLIKDSAELFISKERRLKLISVFENQFKKDEKAKSLIIFEGDVLKFYIVNENNNKRLDCTYSNLGCYLKASKDFEDFINILRKDNVRYLDFFPDC